MAARYQSPQIRLLLIGCFAITFSLAIAQRCPAWNALGHKVVADIAWRQLDAQTRADIVRTLRRHPRFDDDFAKEGDAGDDRWVFQQAAVWPDLARGQAEYDKPTWHYINHPQFIGLPREVSFNLGERRSGRASEWNVAQAIDYCQSVVASNAPPSQKALAYSWLIHLVGDVHQPMHSTALVCDRFPKGDRGGNLIPVQSDNLHVLWDNFLGRQHRLQDVQREVAELEQCPELWRIEQGDASQWIAESHQLAEFAYAPEILAAVAAEGELIPIRLPKGYLKEAGAKARGRIVAAGVRLAVVLGAQKIAPPAAAQDATSDAPFTEAMARPTRSSPSAALSATPSSSTTHWLNLNGNVRHNSSCRWYENTKRGRLCTPDEGRPCGQCGG